MEEEKKLSELGIEPDVNRTRNLLIWSQTRYHYATDPLILYSLYHLNDLSLLLQNIVDSISRQTQRTTQLYLVKVSEIAPLVLLVQRKRSLLHQVKVEAKPGQTSSQDCFSHPLQSNFSCGSSSWNQHQQLLHMLTESLLEAGITKTEKPFLRIKQKGGNNKDLLTLNFFFSVCLPDWYLLNANAGYMLQLQTMVRNEQMTMT
ncbi:hypothetical protein Lal_00020158 [Lupinus albus]|nr:hypothetical protein Lal_00020158 [Lupinus albus]